MRAPLAWLTLGLTAGCAPAVPVVSPGNSATHGPAATAAAGSGTPPAPATPPGADPKDPEDGEHHDPEGHYAEDEDAPDDGAEPEPLAATGPRPPHPLQGWSAADIERQLQDDVAALGSMSIGRPSAGALVSGVQLPESDAWVRVDAANAWGTQETIDYLSEAIAAVRRQYADAPPLYVGHISAKKGGALRPHISHQAGRDVDISYYYVDDSARWYARAHAKNLDVERTWAFIRALVVHTDIEMILCDHSIQRLLRAHALAAGEDPDWVASLFNGVPGSLRPLIVHAKGHATHLHLRFFNPIAQETARRAHQALLAQGRIRPPTYYVSHRVKKGETLGMLAKKYGTTVREIQRANGLRSTKIIAKRSYRIPRRGQVGAARPVAIPPRRRPPEAGPKASLSPPR